jgi:hypothetical protein
MKIEKQTTYSYSLGLDFSLDTHIEDLLAFFQNRVHIQYKNTPASLSMDLFNNMNYCLCY